MGIFVGMPYLVDNSKSWSTSSTSLFNTPPPRGSGIPRKKYISTKEICAQTVDPEMRKEWEEQQKNGGPMAGLMGGGGGGGQASPNPIQNFDMAAFLAGSSNKDSGSGSSASPGAKKEKGGKR